MNNKNKKIPKELKRLSPFFHDIELEENINIAPEIYRIRNARNMFFPPLLKLFGGSLKGLKVLDAGCNCGGFSFEASKRGAKKVIGIDSNKKNIEQANAIKKYMKNTNTNFIKMNIEDIGEKDFGKFDLTIMAGLIYHLENPIGVMEKISKVTKSAILIDSHIHYSNNDQEEDIPSWWMLNDMDENNLEGLFEKDEILSSEKYLEFEKQSKVDYKNLKNQFKPSPQTERDIEFIKNQTPHPSEQKSNKYEVGAYEKSNLALIPNKKALYKLVRRFGFEDILEIIPHRFSSIPYKRKYRISFIAMKRDEQSKFPISKYQSMIEEDK